MAVLEESSQVYFLGTSAWRHPHCLFLPYIPLSPEFGIPWAPTLLPNASLQPPLFWACSACSLSHQLAPYAYTKHACFLPALHHTHTPLMSTCSWSHTPGIPSNKSKCDDLLPSQVLMSFKWLTFSSVNGYTFNKNVMNALGCQALDIHPSTVGTCPHGAYLSPSYMPDAVLGSEGTNITKA